MDRRIIVAIMAIAFVGSVRVISAHQQFEVASIKPHNPSGPCCSLATPGGERFSAVGVTVKALIGVAYRVQPFQIEGGSSWIDSDRFDIEAKAESPTDLTEDRMPVLLQALLADRFHLKVHTGTKDLPVYELGPAKGGSKLQEVPPPEPVRPGTPDSGPIPGKPGMLVSRSGEISGVTIPLEMFLRTLTMRLNRPIVDKSGLHGFFDIKLQWDAQSNPTVTPSEPAVDSPSGLSLFTAIQEQLGLKLETAKGPVEVIVIDVIEKPLPN